jgi:hypothetical protein
MDTGAALNQLLRARPCNAPLVFTDTTWASPSTITTPHKR